MSWLYSQALVEEYLGDNFSDGEQSVPLNGSHTQLAYLPPDKMTAFSRVSRFGMTFKPLTADLGEELLKSFQEDFLVKIFPLQEKEMDLMESDQECGSKWRGSFAKWDQSTSLWRTHQCSFLGDLEPFSETYPQWGLMRNGELWEQKTLVQTTKGTESGLWLTPTVMDGLPARNPEALERQYQNNRKGRTTHSTLREQVVYPPPKEMFPTPRSCSAMASTITPESAWDEKRNPNLETIVGRRMFPTPNAWDGKRGPRSEEHLRTKKAQVTLVTAVAQLERQNFPTPCATDYKGAGQTGQLRDRLDYAAERGATKSKTFTAPTVPGGQLNPTWVEWLMGWTLGWTDLKPLAMDKSLSVPQLHGDS
jgi:DNA (cytosine-5)-methyltransferase 1